MKNSTRKLWKISNKNFWKNGKNHSNKKCSETEDCGSVSLWKDMNSQKFPILSRTFMKKIKLRSLWQLKNNKWRLSWLKWKRSKRKAKRKRRNLLKRINSKRTTQDVVQPKLWWPFNKKLTNTQRSGRTKQAQKTSQRQRKSSKLYCLKLKTRFKRWWTTWLNWSWLT